MTPGEGFETQAFRAGIETAAVKGFITKLIIMHECAEDSRCRQL